ncbi:MAG: UPF0175 family protein [Chloroflexi bacterium]|nr:UPF0175 family protein [Chloroflexota bacterium]
MAMVSFEVPDEALQELGSTPESFACAVRLAAAMHWYRRSDVSVSTAAAIAGLNQRDFLLALSQHEQDIFVVDPDQLDRELARG